MADLLDKTQTTSVSQTDSAIYVVNARTTAPVDRWETPGDFHKNRTGNDSVLAYASLSAAITAIGSTQSTIEIPAATTVSASLTIPANVTLLLVGAGMISVSSAQTLTINGPILAPMRQIFTGAGSVRFGIHVEKSYPQWWGAVFDNSTDDTTAIQKAIDAFTRTNKPHAGGEVFISGGAVITTSLLIHETSAWLRGPGWGIESEAPYRGFIRWNGAAGSPMIKISDCMNAGVEGIRLIGKTSAKPSAGIEFTRTVSAVVQADQIFARHVWIGSYFGYDTNNSKQFAAGIVISGTTDTDTNYFEHLALVNCDIGIDVQNGNASVSDYRTVLFSLCGTGFKAGARVIGSNWNFGANDLDIQLVNNVGRLSLKDVTSEGAVKFADMGTATELYIDDLGFQISNSLNGSGLIIDGDTSDARVVLRNPLFTTVGGYTGATPKLLVRNTGGSSHNLIHIENIKGLREANMDFATSGGGLQDMRDVYISRSPSSDLDWGISDHFYLTNSETYSEGINEFRSKVKVYGGPLTVAQLAAPANLAVVATGGTGTTYGYRVSAISGTGETLACSTVTVSGGATLSGSVYNMLTWDPVKGTDGYKVYGRTNGSELLMATVRPSTGTKADGSQVTSFKDDGSLTPSGALPGANSSASASVEGTLKVGTFTSTQRDALTAADGMVLYNSTTSKLQVRAGGAWVDLH